MKKMLLMLLLTSMSIYTKHPVVTEFQSKIQIALKTARTQPEMKNVLFIVNTTPLLGSDLSEKDLEGFNRKNQSTNQIINTIVSKLKLEYPEVSELLFSLQKNSSTCKVVFLCPFPFSAKEVITKKLKSLGFSTVKAPTTRELEDVVPGVSQFYYDGFLFLGMPGTELQMQFFNSIAPALVQQKKYTLIEF